MDAVVLNQQMKHSVKIPFKVGLSTIFINAMVRKKKEDYRLSEIDELIIS